jgi:hypothetical protein
MTQSHPQWHLVQLCKILLSGGFATVTTTASQATIIFYGKHNTENRILIKMSR